MHTAHSCGSFMYIYPFHIVIYLYHSVFSFGSHMICVYIPIVFFSLNMWMFSWFCAIFIILVIKLVWMQ